VLSYDFIQAMSFIDLILFLCVFFAEKISCRDSCLIKELYTKFRNTETFDPSLVASKTKSALQGSNTAVQNISCLLRTLFRFYHRNKSRDTVHCQWDNLKMKTFSVLGSLQVESELGVPSTAADWLCTELEAKCSCKNVESGIKARNSQNKAEKRFLCVHLKATSA
jgi:hypothetical protein